MTATHAAERLVDRLRGLLEDSLAASVPAAAPAALVDLPTHNNSGDSAIWLGELAFFSHRGIQPAYTCDIASYHPGDLERRAATGPIFLHGGGNFGDLWPAHQALRERVLADFPSRDVIQLPQTVSFSHRAGLDRLVALQRSRTGGFTVHCRDRASVQLLASAGLDAHLTPDMAFALGRLPRAVPPTHDVVVVRRRDHERTDEELELPARWSVRSTDWLDVDGIRMRRRITTRSRAAALHVASRATGTGPVDARLRQLPVLFHARLAQARLNHALRILSSGRVVVTDRLHGHILALLLGVPHVLIPDQHDKVRRFHEAFTSDSPLTTMLGRPCDVAPQLARLLREPLRSGTS